MKTELNGRDNQLVCYWPVNERADAEILKLLMQLNNLDITATLGGQHYSPVIKVERNGHSLQFKAGTLLVVHNRQQMSVLPPEIVDKLRAVLQLDDQLELADNAV